MKISSEKQAGIEIVEEGFLDCGATGKFIDQNYTRDKGLKTEPLKEPIKVYNVDGTLNKQGTIRQYVDLNIEIHGRTCKERFLVTGLGRQKTGSRHSTPWNSLTTTDDTQTDRTHPSNSCSENHQWQYPYLSKTRNTHLWRTK